MIEERFSKEPPDSFCDQALGRFGCVLPVQPCFGKLFKVPLYLGCRRHPDLHGWDYVRLAWHKYV